MALKGSVTIDATPNSCDLLVFAWEATQDRSTNASTITWVMNLVASEEYGLIYGVYKQKDWTVTIDGQETTGTADINIDYGETKTLASGTTVVNHEPDGTKTFDFEFGINMDISGWGAKTETHDCPECDGTGLDATGDACTICDGVGSITSSSEGVYIGWQRGSGTGELDAIIVEEPDPEEPEPEPEPEEPEKFDLQSFLTGLAMALCSRGRIPHREPVAFLYGHVAKEGETPTHTINGVGYVGAVLPDIETVWTDKKTYHYAHITRFDGGTYTIYNLKLSQLPAECSGGKNVTTPAPYMIFQIDPSNPDWVFNRASTTGETTAYTPLLWSNHDILNFAASDPIPIYE